MYLCVCLFVCMSNITIFTQEQALAQAELKRLEEDKLLKYNSEEALKRVRAAMKRRILLKKERELMVEKERENDEEMRRQQLQLVQDLAKRRLEEDLIKKKRREWKKKMKLGLLKGSKGKVMKNHKSERDGNNIHVSCYDKKEGSVSQYPYRYDPSSDYDKDDKYDYDDDQYYGRAEIASAHEVFDSLQMDFQFDNFLDEAAAFQLHQTMTNSHANGDGGGVDGHGHGGGDISMRAEGKDEDQGDGDVRNDNNADGDDTLPVDRNHSSKCVRVVDDWDDLYIDHNGQQTIVDDNNNNFDSNGGGDYGAIGDDHHDDHDDDDDDDDDYESEMNDHDFNDYLLLRSIDKTATNNSYSSHKHHSEDSLQHMPIPSKDNNNDDDDDDDDDNNNTNTNKGDGINKPIVSSKVIKKTTTIMPHQLQKTPYFAHYRSYHDRKGGVEGKLLSMIAMMVMVMTMTMVVMIIMLNMIVMMLLLMIIVMLD